MEYCDEEISDERRSFFFKMNFKLLCFAIDRIVQRSKPTKYRRKSEYFSQMQFITARHAMLESVSREIYQNNIIGNVAEAGVYRGEFAKYINVMFPDRKLYLIDTFEGFDARNVKTERKKGFSEGNEDFTQTSIELVLNQMAYKKNCIVKKGFFPETMNNVEDSFCFVSLDMDLYEATLSGLNWFWPRMVNGGVIFVHDCRNQSYIGCRKAVEEFALVNHVGFIVLPDGEGSAVMMKT